ncbi:hypothetical protein CCACVL1_12122 [Corchorus capsularis]|uniref:Uncharacterized protein n=1 Tax=Corchorus capsularis TaxID=210143 RepID=A0A1R3IHG5_COCAP|nr:hypothetical protein CCACVL1_12122 [Corchorus capsularis]
MWKEETILKKEFNKQQETHVNSRGELLIDTEYEPLVPKEEKSELQILCLNLRWKRLLVLATVWVLFTFIQVIKNDLVACSTWYWVLFCLQVASATATFVMMFSSSLSVIEFYLLKRFPIPYALYLMGVSILAGFWGQYFVRKLITILRRASIIVFILSGVIFASALTMGVIGIETSIKMIQNHEFMGFLDFCSSQ